MRFQRDQLAAQSIPVKVEGNNVALVKVKLNDAEPVDMIFDSGASSVSLSAAVAKRAGIVPGANDPVVTATIANGAVVERRLVDFKDKTAEVDAAKLARHEWSEVVGCDFYRCRVSTLATWFTRECNLFECSAPDTLETKTRTDLIVAMGLGPNDASLTADLKAKTVTTAAGKVTYAAAAAVRDGGISKGMRRGGGVLRCLTTCSRGGPMVGRGDCA